MHTESRVHRATSADVLRAIAADGWFVVRVRGSHHHLKHPTRRGLVTVPHPRKDMPLGTRRAIARQSGVALA